MDGDKNLSISEVYGEVTAVVSPEVITVIRQIGLDVLLTLDEHIHSARPKFYGKNGQYTVTGSFVGISSARKEFQDMLVLLKSYLSKGFLTTQTTKKLWCKPDAIPSLDGNSLNQPANHPNLDAIEIVPPPSDFCVPKSESTSELEDAATESKEFPQKFAKDGQMCSSEGKAEDDSARNSSGSMAEPDCIILSSSPEPLESEVYFDPSCFLESQTTGKKLSFAELAEDHKQAVRKCKRFKKSTSDMLSIRLEKMKLSGSENSSDGENKLNADRSRKKVSKDSSETSQAFKYFCHLCSFKSRRSSHLQKHMLVHGKGTSVHKCGFCKFTAIRRSHLRRHELVHSSAVKACSHCTYRTDDGRLLWRHMQLKHSKVSHNKCEHRLADCKRLYRCDHCPYKTTRKDHHFRHSQSMHASERNFLCHLCGKGFKRADTLQQHHLTHEELRDTSNVSYKCMKCQKTFTTYSNLYEHKEIHLDERHYLCDICGASFKTRSVHRKHMVSIHKSPHSYPCPSCSQSFSTSYAMKRHLAVHAELHTTPKVDPTDVLAEKLKQVAMQPSVELHSVSPNCNANTSGNTVASQSSAIVSPPQEEMSGTSVSIPQSTPAVLQHSETPTTLVFLTNIPPQH